MYDPFLELDRFEEENPPLDFIVFGSAPWDWDGAWETDDEYMAAQEAVELWEVA